jgi:flagellar motor switch protein FliG
MRWAVAAAMLAISAAGTARAERRAPNGTDAPMLETRVREDIERRINPLLEQMAPGQAELKYVDVRVARPSALAPGSSPGFEELTPGTEYVVEKAEVQLVIDAKLPPPFRRDLKNLIKNRLDAIAVPIEIKETVIPFPTPRPQPTTREPLPYYPQPPQQPQGQQQPTPAPATPPAPPPETGPRGIPTQLAVALAVLGLLIGALAVALVFALRGRRSEARAARDDRNQPAGQAAGTATRAATVDHLPEVRRALREDRVLARRVMGELLRENQLDKVAIAVELIGPSVVEDLRGDPTCAGPLREAAALLVEGRAQGDKEVQEVVAQLHRRVLKHRMVGAEDPVAQQFAFLQGLNAARLAAVLAPETAVVQAAALRYAPTHLRTAYLAERSPAERAALAAALAAPKTMSKEHMLDVASTLRDRAAEQAHLDAGETGDIDLAVELIEERPAAEQAEILEAMRRADPAKARAVRNALIGDESFVRVGEDVLVAAAVAVSTETLVRFLRGAPEEVASRLLGVLPPTVSGAVREELSLEVAPTPAQAADARRALYASLRKALRDRGLAAPGAALLATADNDDKGKVVAL